jgi:hypothetical protein
LLLPAIRGNKVPTRLAYPSESPPAFQDICQVDKPVEEVTGEFAQAFLSKEKNLLPVGFVEKVVAVIVFQGFPASTPLLQVPR